MPLYITNEGWLGPPGISRAGGSRSLRHPWNTSHGVPPPSIRPPFDRCRAGSFCTSNSDVEAFESCQVEPGTLDRPASQHRTPSRRIGSHISYK